MGGYWGLTATQFAALWRGTGQDRLPYPFRIVSQAATAAEHESIQRAERDRFADPEFDVLQAALLILAEPELRIEISGHLVAEDSGRQRGTRVPLRMMGAVQRGYGLVAVQHPDVDGHSGNIVMRGCEPYDIPRQLIAQLPDVDAGRARPVTIRRNSSQLPATIDPAIAQSRRDFEGVLNRVESSQGVVTVHRGSRLDSHRVGGVAWRDIIGDGRYLIFGDSELSQVTVQPGSSWDLLANVTSTVGPLAAGQAR
ncbi:MAG: ESX secretion-associated protein EspG [Rhodococcus sp.]|mgnify:CR=1 FL=1|nr:ESX secretion-associated protein EspG [Rhodococcus sp. (in: high G+C Gram-positive bacteria)]